MDYSSFLKVSREAIKAIGADPITLAIYIAITARARWEGPVTRTTAHGVVDLDLGQCYLGRAELAEEVGTTEQRVRTALRRLETHRILTIESTKLGTIATLIGYRGNVAKAQADQPSRPPSTNQGPTTTKREDQSFDLSSPEPVGGVRLDLDQRRGPISAPVVEPNGLSAWEESQRIARGESMPGLRLLQGGGDS